MSANSGCRGLHSGPEVKERAATPVHRERHGVVDVRDFPRAVFAPEAGRGTEPEIDPLAVGLGTGHVAEPDRIRDVAADDDLQIARLGPDGAVPGVEPLLDVLRIALGLWCMRSGGARS